MNNLTLNDTLTGSLTDSDELNPLRSGSYYQDYQLTDLVVGEAVVINLSSDDFDSYLQLIDADTGEVVVEIDELNSSYDSRLSFITDVRNSQYETDETNNTVAIPVKLNNPDLDLTIGDINVPNKILIGDTVEANWTVTNQGTESTTKSWWDYIYLSDDENLDDDDTYLTSYATAVDGAFPFAGGENYTKTQSFTVPNTQTGDRFLIYTTDYLNERAETNETNNTVAIPVTITTPDVDLAISTDLESITADIGDRV